MKCQLQPASQMPAPQDDKAENRKQQVICCTRLGGAANPDYARSACSQRKHGRTLATGSGPPVLDCWPLPPLPPDWALRPH